MIPETAKRGDWPRLVKLAFERLNRDKFAAADFAALQDFADDTAAATGGVAIGSLYRTGSVVKVRVS